MKKMIAILALYSIVIACKYDTGPTEAQLQEKLKYEAELQEKLKQTMNDYLYKGVNNDSSKVKFNVLSVAYFANEKDYACEFKVRMRQKNLDTVGIMEARVSKDFSKIFRKS